MKKFIVSLVATIIVVSFSACGGGGDNNQTTSNPINTGLSSTNLPAEFPPGEFGEINLTANYKIPKEALFLDIRNPHERYDSDNSPYGRHAKGSIGGAIYEFRPPSYPSKRVNPDFVNDVLSLPEVNGDRSRYIILICNSSSRTKQAAEWLSTPKDQKWREYDGGGFTRVYHIVGGMEKWADELHLPIIDAQNPQ